jgi:2-amino-4-hydroxy-6-hydroxymethyldihydropteridine diphosphokinase
MPTICYIGLGSNVGDRLQNIKKAVSLIADWPDNKILKISSIYETEPWGVKDQAPFFNAVIEISTNLLPEVLLKHCLDTEKQMGRIRTIKWGPRIIDLDILFYGSQVIKTDTLVIPHPLLAERDFVIIPLNDIAPDYIHPVTHLSIHKLAASFDFMKLHFIEKLIIEPK